MIVCSRWKEVTALSILLPLLSTAPASARRDGDDQRERFSRSNLAERNLRNSFKALDASCDRGRPASLNFATARTQFLPDVRVAREIQLDLTSQERNIALSSRLFKDQSWVTVNVGGTNKTFSEGQNVTAAEYVAISQALKGDGQTLLLNEHGAATGGDFSLNLLKQSRSFRTVSDLVIPERVTAIEDVSRGTLKFSGDIVNHGQILGVSNARGQQGKIFADNIFNHDGAVISMDAIVPSAGALTPNLVSELVQLSSTISNGTKLLLSATEQVVNAGTIFSAGDLTISGAEVSNIGVIFSGDSLMVETQKITNSGIVKAMGPVMSIIGTSVSEGLKVVNNGGRFDATNGSLLMSAQGAINVVGGALNAQVVRFQTPYSMVEVVADSISGLVEVLAASSAVHVAQGDLLINTIEVSGDPIFTNSMGSITLPANISASGFPVTAVAARDIYGAAGGTKIDTSSVTDNGGEVILLAGVANTTAGGITTVSGASGFGGSISGITGINASGALNRDGGAVTIGAFDGTIEIAGPILTTGQTGGRVNIFAPGNITVGDISSRGGHLREDVVTIRTVNPVIASLLTFDSTGKRTAGSVGMGTSIGHGSIVAGNIESGTRGPSGADAGNINILAGGSVATGFLRAMGGGAPGRGWALQGYDYGSNGGHGGNISVVAQGGGVLINGDVNSSGGGGGGANHTDGGQGGDGGNVLITAIADVILNGPVLAPGGGGGGGVGISSTDTAGGGGSLGNGGGPNSGGVFYAPAPYDGPGMLDNGLNPRNPNRHRFPYAGMGGTNTAYDIGCCGSGYGGDVGEFGEDGDEGTFAPRGYWNDTSPRPGGAPGIGGNITMSGRDIVVTKTIQTFYNKKDIEKSPYAGYSVFTHSERGGGQITLTTSGGSAASSIYGANSDLESTAANIAAQIRPGQVSLTGKMRGDVVQLNGNALATEVNGGILPGSGPGIMTITVNGSNKTVTTGTMLTASEWIAVIQKSLAGDQGLTIGAGGSTTSGEFVINSVNLPSGGFTNLVVPTNVVANVNVATLTSTTTNVKGQMNFSGNSSLNSNVVTVSGGMNALDNTLNINAPQVNLNGASISAGSVGIAGSSGLTVNLGSAASTIESTTGHTRIGSTGQALVIANSSGGPTTLNVFGRPIDLIGTTFTNPTNTSLVFGNDTTVTLSGASFQNLGSIKVNDAAGGAGNFLLQSTAANLSANLGNLSIAPLAAGAGGSIRIDAAGNLAIASNNLDASATGAGDFDGGLLSILAQTLTVTGSVLNLTADGVGGGAGGTVSVKTTGVGSTLVVDGTTGHLSVVARGGSTGGDGGRLELASGGNLSVNASAVDISARGTNADGAEFDLEAGTAGNGNLVFTGSVSANGIGTGSGGSVRVASNSATTLSIGSVTANSVSGNLSANSGASGGSAGTITVENAGTGGIRLDNAGVVSANATAGSGGHLNLLSANGLVDLAAGNYFFNGGCANGAGGSMVVDAGQLNVRTGGSQFSANGSGQGAGGLLDVNVKQNQNLTLNSSFFTMSATSGASGGNGGTINVSTGGDLVVDHNVLEAGPQGANGNGAHYAFSAGGTLVVDDLDASGVGNGAGGTIALDFGSALPFVVGGSSLTNGVTGSLVALGAGTGADGTVSFSNNSSDLNIQVGSTVSAGTVSFNSVADVIVDVVGSFSAKVDAAGVNVQIANNTGSLLLNNISATENITAFAADQVTAGGVINGRNINIESETNNVNVLGTVTGTTAVNVIADDSVLFNGGQLRGSTVNVEAENGDIMSATSASVLKATNASLTSGGGNIGTAANVLSFNATNLSANTSGTGVVHLNSAGPSRLNLLDSSAGGEFVLTANGSLTLDDITTGAGEISVRTSSGRMYVNPGANISAIDGDISLRNDDFMLGSIAIGANSTIKGSSTITGVGDVFIGFGNVPTTFPKPKNKHKNVSLTQVGGGNVHVSKNGLRAAGPANTLVAEGRNIIIQSSSPKKNNAISLEGNVTIIADPPSSSTFSSLSSFSLPAATTFAFAEAEAIQVASGESIPSGESVPSGLTDSLNGRVTNLGNAAVQMSSESPMSSSNSMPVLHGNLNSINLVSLSSAVVPTETLSTITGGSQTGTREAIGFWSHDNLFARSSRVVSHARAGEQLHMSSGAVVFAPTTDSIVSLPGMKLRLAAKSVALVVSTDAGVSVFDLDDRHKQSVVIERGDERISLSPGQHVTVTDSADVFAEINPIEAIPHRGLKTIAKADGKHVFTSEFSIFAALDTVQPLRDVLNSKHERSVQISSNLMKTAAVVMQLRGLSDFETHARPQYAAWNQK